MIDRQLIWKDQVKWESFSLFFIVIIVFGLTSCDSLKKKTPQTWAEKNAQILDSLSRSNSVIDSLIILNRFAHRDATHGAPELNCDSVSSKTQRIHWNSRQWYRYFLKDSITVYCGCNSEFYKALVNDYMSENVIVNGFSIGVPEKVIGHYLSLVVVVQPHQSNMYLFDSMFNGFYSLVNGEIPDIRYLIYLIRKNRTDLFTFKTHDDLSSYLLRFKHNFNNSNALFDLAYPYYYEASVNEHFPVKLRAKRTLDHYLKTEFAKTYQQIARYHQGKNLSYETS